MKLRAAQASRTMTALVCTVLAVAAPCTAWFVVGAREAHQRAAELENAPRRQARELAARLAERLRDRLETLRDRESQRPFYHYQNFYHDPRGAYEGIAVVPSPLAQGPIDPLIRTYFQLESSGRFTLPQLAPFADQAEQRATPDTEELKALRQQLELQAPTYVAVVQQDVQQQQLEAQSTSSYRSPKESTPGPVQVPAPAAARAPQRRVETLDTTAWAQNVQASEVYRSLRQQQAKTAPTEAGDDLGKVRGGKGQVRIVVGDLQWHTILINKALSLLALRDIETPQGRIVQGFLISRDGINDVLQALPFPAQFQPGPPEQATDAAVPLDANPWHVSVDAEFNLEDAHARAHAVWRDFLRLFCAGVAVASVAGVFVVWLVWQSERLAKQRSQFAASAAHELRTPLAGLRMYSEMLAEGLGDPAKAGDYARRIADEASRLGRVVANVLGFTRLEHGQLEVHPESGDLGAAVREVVARLQPALAALGAQVAVTVPDGLAPVTFDRDALAQILQNLLDNAEKHTRHAADRSIQVGVEARPGVVELTVTDHGPGVPRGLRRRLFRPFARDAPADAPAGLGLGLVLVRALVRAQGGTVTYHDAPGGGAQFVVRFPG